MLGNMWEHRDEKAFVARQSLFREAEENLISARQLPQKIILQGA